MLQSRQLPRSAFQARKPARAGRPAWKCAEEFRRWLRKLPCACQGRNEFCDGPTEAAHVDMAGRGTPDAKGMGSKVADRHSLPLSRGCHAGQHRVGWLTFERTLPMSSAVALSFMFWEEWPGRPAWERENGR